MLFIIVVAVIGFAGYTVLNSNNKATPSDTSEQASTSSSPFKSKADLEAASAELNTVASQLDSDLDTSVLDSDIEQLL